MVTKLAADAEKGEENCCQLATTEKEKCCVVVAIMRRCGGTDGDLVAKWMDRCG